MGEAGAGRGGEDRRDLPGEAADEDLGHTCVEAVMRILPAPPPTPPHPATPPIPPPNPIPHKPASAPA